MTIVLTMGMPKNYDLVCSGGCDSAEQQLRATPHPRSGHYINKYSQPAPREILPTPFFR